MILVIHIWIYLYMDHLSWKWRPYIAGCKSFLTLLRAELAVLTQLFFAKCSFCTCEEAKKTTRKVDPVFPNMGIIPYIWKTSLNVLITGLEDVALNACILFSKCRDRSL